MSKPHRNHHHRSLLPTATWAVVVIILAMASSVWAQASATSTQGTQGDQATSGGSPIHVTPAQIAAREAQLSPALQAHRRAFRAARMVRDEEVQQNKLADLAAQIQADLPKDLKNTELPTWLKLLQGAHYLAGDFEAATETLDRRLEVLGEQGISRSDRTKVLLDEARIAMAMRQYDLSELLYDRAEKTADTAALRFRIVMDFGRLVGERDGTEAAVAYFLDITRTRLDSEPEIAREAHFRAAEQYYRDDQLDKALQMLSDIEAAYPDTPEAEKARHARRGWVKLPGEQ